jgi:hypothetical protein
MAKGSLVAVGTVSIAVAGMGLLWHLIPLWVCLSTTGIPHFDPTLCTMSAICVLCYISLLVCGVQFVRLRTSLIGFFVGVNLFEVIYVLSLMVWLINANETSTTPAFELASVGLIFQWLILFPLWGPLVALYAARWIERNGKTIEQAGTPMQSTDSKLGATESL